MKKLQFLLATILFCSMGIFTSCTNSDNPTPVTPTLSDEYIKSKLNGVFIAQTLNGVPLETTEKTGMKFENGYIYLSAISKEFDDGDLVWSDWVLHDLKVKDGCLRIPVVEDGIPYIYVKKVTAISDTELDCITHLEKDGEIITEDLGEEHWEKTSINMGDDICGMWEVQFTSPMPERVAGKTFGVYFRHTGDAVLFNKDASGEWKELEGYDYAAYVNVGPLVFIRWDSKGSTVSQGKGWEITSFKDNVMKVKVEYYADESSTELLTMTADLVKQITPTVSDEIIKSKILGQWLYDNFEGEPVHTAVKRVMNFTSLSECSISLLDTETYFEGGKMVPSYKNDVQLSNGVLTMTYIDEDGQQNTTINRVVYLDNQNLIMEVGEINVGETEPPFYEMKHWVKTTADYSQEIIGTWEGTIPEEAAGDGKLSRWEFMADGKYKYYKQDASGNWVQQEGHYAGYFTAGPLLVMRWAYAPRGEKGEVVNDDGYVHRSASWEISIDGESMIWKDDDLTVNLKNIQ